MRNMANLGGNIAWLLGKLCRVRRANAAADAGAVPRLADGQ